MVCQVIYRYVGDKVVAEDIAQEIFTELWQKRDQLHIHTSPQAYLRRMAVTRTLNYLRNERKHKWDDLEDEVGRSGMWVSQRPNALANLELAELQQVIARAIDELPEKCRIVFLLSRHESMPYADIAAALDISVKTVENQIGKALRHLRNAVESYRGI
jgi:RNA polymerase sigma-70 factor (ECF subfamily)